MRKYHKTEIALFITGSVSLILYFTDNVFAALLFFFIGTAYLLIYVQILLNQRKKGIYFGLFVFMIVGVDQLLKSEILKAKIILSAILKDGDCCKTRPTSFPSFFWEVSSNGTKSTSLN